MAPSLSRLSIFSHTLDRVAFLAYALGALVPLLALAYVTHVFVLPQLPAGPFAWAFAGLVVAIAALSLASFLVLRRVTRQSIRRIEQHRQRLERLLEVSGSFAAASHADEIRATTARCAAETIEARAAFVLQGEERQAAPKLLAAAGADATQLHDELRTPIDSLAKLCLSRMRSALLKNLRKADAGTHLTAAAAVPLQSAGSPPATVLVIHTDPGRAFDEVQLGTLSTLSALAGVALHNLDLREAQQNFFTHMTDILVSAMDAHLDLQGGHARRVAHLSNAIGHALGFDDARLQRLHFAALLHDVGMLKIDSKLWANKRAARMHPVLGGRMLARIRLWEEIAPIVLNHHEWWNGEGYPEGVAGEGIPLEARIIGLAEAFDTMTSETSYRVPISVSQALEEIERCSGSQFDPEVARLFLKLVPRGAIKLDVASRG